MTMHRTRRLIGALGIAAAALIGAACGPVTTPGPPAATPTCSVTNIENVATHRITITGESNIGTGQDVTLMLYGNGAFLGSYTTDVGNVGAISYTLDLPQYGYTVGWEVQVTYKGRVLCFGGYTDFTGEIDPEWAALPNDPGWWYGN